MSTVKRLYVTENKNRTWLQPEIRAAAANLPDSEPTSTSRLPLLLQRPVWPSAVTGLVTSVRVLGSRRPNRITLCPSLPSVQACRRGVSQLLVTHSHGCFVLLPYANSSVISDPGTPHFSCDSPSPDLARYLNTCSHFSDEPCSLYTGPFSFNLYQIVHYRKRLDADSPNMMSGVGGGYPTIQ